MPRFAQFRTRVIAPVGTARSSDPPMNGESSGDALSPAIPGTGRILQLRRRAHHRSKDDTSVVWLADRGVDIARLARCRGRR
jgi:hypothetical protein